MQIRLIIVLLLLSAAPASHAQATWPAKPVRLILGVPAGGTPDVVARMVTPGLSSLLGQQFVVDNRGGASGVIATELAARAVPDGYTLFFGAPGSITILPHLAKKVPYDAQRDFEPVTLLTQSPMLLACHPSLPSQSVSEFVAHARARTGALALTYGTSAIGGAPHLAAELFQSVTGVALRHARYDETQKLYADLEAGRIDLSFNNILSMLPRCASGKKSGTLRALGVTSAQRCAIAAHIPTLAESGLRRCEVSNWVGLVAPRGTPVARVDAIAAAAATVIQGAGVSTALNDAGITPCGYTPAAFAQFMASELERWRPVVAKFAHH